MVKSRTIISNCKSQSEKETYCVWRITRSKLCRKYLPSSIPDFRSSYDRPGSLNRRSQRKLSWCPFCTVHSEHQFHDWTRQLGNYSVRGLFLEILRIICFEINCFPSDLRRVLWNGQGQPMNITITEVFLPTPSHCLPLKQCDLLKEFL